MKRVVETREGPGGLESLLAQEIIVMCQNYFYAGRLTGINTDSIELSNPTIVYETGWGKNGEKRYEEKLPGAVWYIKLKAIESFGVRQ
jgi:hypothetical protein